MACENIYLRCCDRSSVQRKMKQLPPDADDDLIVKDLIEKLDFIQVRRPGCPPLNEPGVHTVLVGIFVFVFHVKVLFTCSAGVLLTSHHDGV